MCSMRVVKHNGCDKQYGRQVCPLLHDGVFLSVALYCPTSFNIDTLLRHERNSLARQCTGTNQAKDVARSTAKSAAQNAVKASPNNFREDISKLLCCFFCAPGVHLAQPNQCSRARVLCYA